MCNADNMKIAIVHDWLPVLWVGAEKCVTNMMEVFPEAVLYTSICIFKDRLTGKLKETEIVTTHLQKKEKRNNKS